MIREALTSKVGAFRVAGLLLEQAEPFEERLRDDALPVLAHLDERCDEAVFGGTPGSVRRHAENLAGARDR